jgi:hypothetical protein
VTNLFIMTSRRPGPEPFGLLLHTLEQLEEEKLPADTLKCVVVDGNEDDFATVRELVDDFGQVATVELFTKPAAAKLGGNKLVYWAILGLAAKLERDALILEDDLENSARALERALMFPVPEDVDLVQFFSGWTLTDERMSFGLWRTPAPFAGCQAVKYPLRTLERLVGWSRISVEFQNFTASDQAVSVAQRRLGLRVANHCPDLFEHDGKQSAVDAGIMEEGNIVDDDSIERAKNSLRGRRSHTWRGKNFDCMRLFAGHELFR